MQASFAIDLSVYAADWWAYLENVTKLRVSKVGKFRDLKCRLELFKQNHVSNSCISCTMTRHHVWSCVVQILWTQSSPYLVTYTTIF